MTDNIAIVTHSQYPIEVRARRMAEACAAHGYAVHVYCLRKPGELPLEELNGVTVHRLPMFRKQGAGAFTYMTEYARFLLMVARLLSSRSQRGAYRLIQVHNPPDFLVYATLVPRLFGKVRVLFDVRDVAPELFLSRFHQATRHPLARLLYLFERLACRYAHAITVCTSYVYDLLADRGVQQDKVQIVMNLPDETIFGRAAVGDIAATAGETSTLEPGKADSSDSPGEAFRLTYHGGMLERYGPDLLVRAVPRLREAIPNLRVDLYGTGDYLPAVEALVTELAVADIVKVHGFIPTEQIPLAVRGADLGIVPMRQDTFTDGLLPTKLMELAAMGVPAVVARTHTTTRYFDDSMVSYFPPGDVDALAASVLALYHDPEQRRRLASEAARFLERHSWSAEKARYLSLVDSLIRGKS